MDEKVKTSLKFEQCSILCFFSKFRNFWVRRIQTLPRQIVTGKFTKC